MDRQTKAWMVPNQWFPPTHTEGIYHMALVDFCKCFLEYRIWRASDWINKWIRYHLAVSWIAPFVFLIFFLQCHLEQHKAHEHGKQKLPSVTIWLCVLHGLQPLIWAQHKSEIDRSADCVSVSLPVQPSLRPSSPPASLPPSLCPRPHWLAMPRFLPTDQSAWCLLCLAEVNKLSGQSWGQESFCLAPEVDRGMGKEEGSNGGVREERRFETEGLGSQREEGESSQLAHFSAWLEK